MNALRNLHRGQKGMTGLETAIILISFVTVAAVFGYAVLSAGLFSAERGKETVYNALDEANNTCTVSGSVVATSDDNINVRTIRFALRPVPATWGGVTSAVLSLTTRTDYINNVRISGFQDDVIIIDLTDLGPGGPLSENLTANDTFTLQVKPSKGASITISRQLPPAFYPVMDLR